MCYYSQKDISVEQEKQEPSTGMITMKQLENAFSESYYVRKNWIDGDNKYGFRPNDITVVLQRSVDRSEERRVGKECATMGRSRWLPSH